jgi:hypothetical protein
LTRGPAPTSGRFVGQISAKAAQKTAEADGTAGQAADEATDRSAADGRGVFARPVRPDLTPQAVLALAAAAGLAAVLVGSAVFRRRAAKASPTRPAAQPSLDVPGPPSARSDSLADAPPAGLFPSQWREKTDQPALDRFISKVAAEAIEAWSSALDSIAGTPSPEDLQEAEDQLTWSLSRSLCSDELFAVLDEGRGLTWPQSGMLAAHFNSMRPPLRLPPPPAPQVRPRAAALGLAAAVGGAAGASLGGAAAAWLSFPPEIGLLPGAALGAAAAVRLAFYLSLNDQVRKILLAAVGGVALTDSLLLIAKGALVPAFLAGGRGSFVKRLAFYLGAAAALVFVKAEKTFDLALMRSQTLAAVEAYLEATAPLAVVLTHRLDKLGLTQFGLTSRDDETKLLWETASLVKRLRARPWASEDSILDELVRKLSNAGFQMSPPAQSIGPQQLIWTADLKDLYETFGLVEDGQPVLVEEEPIVRDGHVLRKGQVVRQLPPH